MLIFLFLLAGCCCGHSLSSPFFPPSCHSAADHLRLSLRFRTKIFALLFFRTTVEPVWIILRNCSFCYCAVLMLIPQRNISRFYQLFSSSFAPKKIEHKKNLKCVSCRLKFLMVIFHTIESKKEEFLSARDKFQKILNFNDLKTKIVAQLFFGWFFTVRKFYLFSKWFTMRNIF